MKTSRIFFITILLVVFLSAFVTAQEYATFPMEESIWTEQNGIYEGGPYPLTWTSLFVTENDTIISQREYVNVYEYYLDPYSFDTIRELYSSIRQDTLGQKVYIIRHYFEETREKKLLDFSKQVGDTIWLGAYFYEYSPDMTDSIYYIDSIKDIEIYNGDVRRVQYLSNYNFHLNNNGQIIIEGVGSVFNPFGPPLDLVNKNYTTKDFCCPDWLLCLTVSSRTHFIQKNVNDCGKLLVWTSLDYNSEDHFKIYPNPADNYLNISLSEKYLKSKVLIYNSKGQLELQTLINKLDFRVNLGNLENGFYTIKIVSNYAALTKSFIINKH